MPHLKTRLRNLKEFLRGQEPLDERWFSDAYHPAFWWRKHLADIDLAITRITVLENEIKRLKKELNPNNT